MSNVKMKFDSSQCANNVCSAIMEFDYLHQTTMYIHYPFFQTSYFVYAKGLAFSDIFKTYSYLTDNFECYPVNTYKQYFDVLGTLGIRQNDDDPFMRKVAELSSKNGGDEEVSPCGLKAALYGRAGNTTFTYENGTNLTSDMMDTEHVVDQRYIDAAKNSTNDYLNVKSGSFLSWYLPQIPGFGTKIVLAVFPNGLKGKFNITFDFSRPD
jgi:hypothetical protein